MPCHTHFAKKPFPQINLVYCILHSMIFIFLLYIKQYSVNTYWRCSHVFNFPHERQMIEILKIRLAFKGRKGMNSFSLKTDCKITLCMCTHLCIRRVYVCPLFHN